MATYFSFMSWRRRAPPQENTQITRAGDAIINMNDLAVTISDNGSTTSPKEKKFEPLFGPNIGIISSGPKWTQGDDKKVVTDPLTPEIVRSWIEKSKEGTHPTTTLQALVNLKRPTLRLSPLSIATSEDAESANLESQHLHGLEFEFDCDAPKCGIYVHALLDPNHPEAENAVPTASGFAKTLVFEQVVDGGFGRILKLEEGAALELDKLDHKPASNGFSFKDGSTLSINGPGEAPAPQSGHLAPPSNEEARRKRRFTPFHFRKRIQGHAVMGPALAVVDAEPATPIPADSPILTKSGEDTDGVKVTIRLAALDQNGVDLSSPNEQTTYLHIVRYGAKPDTSEDTRPWVVQVVKREATIGLHTLHLHEIYGLSSSSSSAPQPTATLPTPSAHDYPPHRAVDDPPSAPNAVSECLVCLSSPREVVLLPCRHLVACKECALNMVEFGAGGTIVQPESETSPAPAPAPVQPATQDGEDGTAAAPSQAIPTAPAPAPVPTPNPRRKRRAKGWSCPVCRQPYTSLLRITTVPDAESEEDQAETAGKEESAGTVETPVRSAGLPSFFRSLSARAAASAAEHDVERNAVAA